MRNVELKAQINNLANDGDKVAVKNGNQIREIAKVERKDGVTLLVLEPTKKEKAKAEKAEAEESAEATPENTNEDGNE